MSHRRSIRAGRALTAAAASTMLAAAPAASDEVLVVPKLVASDAAASSHLGRALARSGDVLVAGAPFATVDGGWDGAAYVFVRDPATGGWVERKRLVSQDPVQFDQFGESVAVSGDTIVVGVPGTDVDGVFDQGAVHVFERHAGGADNWGEVAILTEEVGFFGKPIEAFVNAARVGPGAASGAQRRDRGPRPAAAASAARPTRRPRKALPSAIASAVAAGSNSKALNGSRSTWSKPWVTPSRTFVSTGARRAQPNAPRRPAGQGFARLISGGWPRARAGEAGR